MSYPKLVIVSSGEKTAILLDGKMMSEGIENVEFLAEGATTTGRLQILLRSYQGINCAPNDSHSLIVLMVLLSI